MRTQMTTCTVPMGPRERVKHHRMRSSFAAQRRPEATSLVRYGTCRRFQTAQKNGNARTQRMAVQCSACLVEKVASLARMGMERGRGSRAVFASFFVFFLPLYFSSLAVKSRTRRRMRTQEDGEKEKKSIDVLITSMMIRRLTRRRRGWRAGCC